MKISKEKKYEFGVIFTEDEAVECAKGILEVSLEPNSGRPAGLDGTLVMTYKGNSPFPDLVVDLFNEIKKIADKKLKEGE